MAKVLIKPISNTFKPFELDGELTVREFDGELIYYIAGQSFPAEIVTVVSE